MGLVLAACLVLHVPGWTAPQIGALVDYRTVFANTHPWRWQRC